MPIQLDFSGRTVLITGSGSGIGAATARLLAECGAARLLLADLHDDGMAPERLGCAVQPLIGDVGDPAFWETFEREPCELDHAVINAGVASASPISETSFSDWRRVMSTNLDGAFLSLRAVFRKIRQGGSIVLTASVSGIKPEPGTAAYAASKAAVIQLAKVAAMELAPRAIRVNAIAPGGVDTPIWDAMPFFQALAKRHGGDRSAALAELGAATPMGKFACADDIAAQIAFLLSELAGTVTGTTLITDSGYSL